MSLVRRMQRVTRGRIEQYLAANPGEAGLVACALVDAEGELVRAEGKATAAYRKAQERVDTIEGRIARLECGAELAVRGEQHDLAREALSAQIKTEEELELQRESFERSRNALADARAVRAHIRHLRTVFGNVASQGGNPRDDRLLGRIAALPDGEPSTGARPLPLRTLDERLEQLKRDAVVEARLEEMKRGRKGASSALKTR